MYPAGSQWWVLGQSVRGARHRRGHSPNQDALARLHPGPTSQALLAVADGHGSPRYRRSHQGAKLAVQAAIRGLHEFVTSHGAVENLSTLKRGATEPLPKRIVHLWQMAVAEHLAVHPPSTDEQAPSAHALYGSTLLAAAVTPRYLLLLQLGDGDILIVDDAGQVSRPPFPPDPRLLGNQTISLIDERAWAEFRVHFQPLADHPPALVLLATDGYANAFATEADFLQVGTDLLAAIRQEGPRKVQQRLAHWLTLTSEQGSGDDITVGLLYRAG
ncbi:protein phosphatase 2C domain-containing protein [Litorilinea aerophila]|nr:PP2C family serine/threonine-protein phosphatase [Litorilinea aerophila]MCC9076502.1 protein phosphatase 2C domain-containing protein [Litorilinea aerophila]